MFENLHEINSAFSSKIAGLQQHWDSTSIGLFKTCPRKYQYKMLSNIGTKGQATPLTFGILYHSAMEQFAHLRAQGLPREKAILETIRYTLKQSKDYHPEDESIRTRQNLIRAIVWYFERFEDDPAETLILADGKPAVELSFSFSTGIESAAGENYTLQGHMDRVARLGDQLFVLDHKTTKMALGDYYFKSYNPDNQVSLYTFAAHIVLGETCSGVIIDAAQLGVGFSRYERRTIRRTKAQLEEWYRDLSVFLDFAETCAIRQYYPMNDTACDKYGGCEFRPLCAADGGVRHRIIASDYEEKEPWNPTQKRGVSTND